MLEEKIINLREKLEDSISDGEKYEKTEKLSVELDNLISIYINTYLQKKTKYAKS